MTINPCCIPLKTGVRMVTHLSMALALCVGWSSLKLLSISQEVSTEISTDTSSSQDAINRHQQSHYPGEIPTTVYSAPPPFYNNHNFRRQQTFSPQQPAAGAESYPFKIPYEYILFYNWHQQQLRRHHNLDNQPQQRQQDSSSSTLYGQDGVQSSIRSQQTLDLEREGGFLPSYPPYPQQRPPVYFDTETDEDDEQNKFFRSILHHRKNFKEGPVPPVSPNAGLGMFRKSNESEDHAEISAATFILPTPSPRVQVRDDERESEKEERGHVPIDWSPFFLGNEKEVDSSSHVDQQHHFSPEVVAAAQLSARQHQQQEDAHEMNRRMMSTFTRDYSQRDETPGLGNARTQGRSGDSITSKKKQLPDFKEQYAKVLLVCGLLALCTVIFQFFTAFLLLCFVDKGSNAAAQIYTAVQCSVIFCLATCLVLFLCEGMSMPRYAFDETLYLSVITLDSLLSIYFLWVVMAFI